MAIQYRNAPERGVKYVGKVLEVFQEDYRAMSDIYTLATFALVWNDETCSPDKILVNANFECDVSGGYAEVDADTLIQFAYKNYLQRLEDSREEARKVYWAEQARKERNRPEKGKRMVVVRGRKVKPGTEGVVFWLRDGRVGLDVTGKRDAKGHVVDPVWVAGDYLEAV